VLELHDSHCTGARWPAMFRNAQYQRQMASDEFNSCGLRRIGRGVFVRVVQTLASRLVSTKNYRIQAKCATLKRSP
jgi:hypothetical protein